MERVSTSSLIPTNLFLFVFSCWNKLVFINIEIYLYFDIAIVAGNFQTSQLSRIFQIIHNVHNVYYHLSLSGFAGDIFSHIFNF